MENKSEQKVSCMCLTYGRPKLLEESIFSFINQDYQGPKELIILNDYEKQILKFDHPDVRIINISKRFNTVGEKRNYCFSLCNNDILFVWDDDDIYLPSRISFTLDKMKDPKYNDFFKPSKAFFFDNKKQHVKGVVSNLFHSGGAFTRRFFEDVNGYSHMGTGEDLDIESRMKKNKNYLKHDYNEIKDEDIFYIYRWNTGSYHLSGFGRDEEDGLTGNDKVYNYIENQLKRGTLEIGDIYLNPHWLINYEEKIKYFLLEKLKT
jgi:hypothetical protein